MTHTPVEGGAAVEYQVDSSIFGLGAVLYERDASFRAAAADPSPTLRDDAGISFKDNGFKGRGVEAGCALAAGHAAMVCPA